MSFDPVTSYRWLEEQLVQGVNPRPWAAAINLRLERITALLDALDHPERGYPIIHVGGTSGKGSTATVAAGVLRAHGWKVGLHLSPHIQILNERHQIDLRPAATSQLVALWPRVADAIQRATDQTRFGRASYFEAQLALSLVLFAEAKVDVAVIEVGVGGTRDATNVLSTDVAVLTNVGLDHTDLLGDTVEEIATDKIGIIKPGQAVISGVHQPSVIQLVRARCAAQGAHLSLLGAEIQVTPDTEETFSLSFPGHRFVGLRTQMTGHFQAINAALGIAAVAALIGPLVASKVREGLAVQLPGRIETVQQTPRVILDGAHNPDKIRGALVALQEMEGIQRRIAVVGLKAGKDAETILPGIAALCDTVILTRFTDKGPWRAIAPEKLQLLLPEATVIADPLEATRAAIAQAGPTDLVWVTGSLYLVGDVRALWYPPERLLHALEGAGQGEKVEVTDH